jgi:hypothetical protein
MASNLLNELYEPHVQAARARVRTDPQLTRLLDPNVDPRLLELFFIHYCSLGVQMTEPVESWIHRAGQRCKDLGYEDLGKALMTHAKHEAGHHVMMIEDTHKLVKHWNARRTPKLDAGRLLAQLPTAPVRAYSKLHEDTIAGDAPFGQSAIEHCVEALSPTLGKALIDQVRKVLGQEFVDMLSFLTEHVELDVGHTQLNEKMIERFLTAHPDKAEAIAKTGARAIEIYLDFMGDCVRFADAILRDAPTASAAAPA